MVASGAPELIVGLVLFSLGLAAFVFATAVADELGDRIDVGTGHRAMVATRTAGLAGMSAGVVVLLL